jgi:hypothetical protein
MTTTPWLLWPERFHMLIPMQFALVWPTIEGGDKARAGTTVGQYFTASLKNALIDWDASQKTSAQSAARCRCAVPVTTRELPEPGDDDLSRPLSLRS